MREQARIVVGILSGGKEESRRQACRDTWVNQLNIHVPVMFLLGDPKLQQAQCNGEDTLFLPCPDTYPALPQKTRQFCRYALETWDFDYLFKCDDDTYVHADRFLAYDQRGRDYIGIDPTGEKTFNSGGAGYFLSRRAAEIVAQHLTNPSGAEDLLVGKLMSRFGIERTEDYRFQAWLLDRTIPTQQNDGITVHYVRGQEMHRIHSQFQASPSCANPSF